MRILILFLTFVSLSNITAQSFEPFLETPYYNLNIDLICLEDGKLVSLNIIPGVEYVNYTYVRPIDVGYTPLSSVVVYNQKGIEIGSVGLPDTDSTVFWAANMVLLQDGRICIGGDFVNVNNESHNAFFAILNIELTGFDKIEILEENLPLTSLFIKEANGNIIFYSNYGIREYSTTGYLNHVYVIPSTIQMDSIFYFSFHSFNNKKYSFYGNGSYSIRYYGHDENNTPSYNVVSNSNMYPYTDPFLRFRYSTRGKNINNQEYLINSVVYNDSISYANVLKIDDQGEFSTFFSNQLPNFTFFNSLATTIDFHDDNYIYLAYQNVLAIPVNYTIYCLKNDGTIRWEKSINLNSELTKTIFIGGISALAATKDKGVIITVSALDESSNTNVYYCKLDSLGNTTSFFTSIDNLKTEINDFNLYPNPTSDFLHLETNLKGSFFIEIYSTTGKMVLKKSILKNNRINMSKLTKGMYFYKILNEENVQIQEGKIMVD